MTAITLETLAEAIRRDPPSWKGISLAFLGLSPGISSEMLDEYIHDEANVLTIQGKDNELLLLGTELTPSRFAGITERYTWIRDITSEWPYACGVIESMFTQVTATPAITATTSDVQASLPKLSILVVEDEPMTSKLIAHQLAPFGSVISTENTKQATATSAVSNPDIVLVDIHYKDDICDGFDVLANVLSMNPNAFVVMISGNRDPATICKALVRGAQGFIAKPFRAEDVVRYCAMYVARLSRMGQ